MTWRLIQCRRQHWSIKNSDIISRKKSHIQEILGQASVLYLASWLTLISDVKQGLLLSRPYQNGTNKAQSELHRRILFEKFRFFSQNLCETTIFTPDRKCLIAVPSRLPLAHRKALHRQQRRSPFTIISVQPVGALTQLLRWHSGVDRKYRRNHCNAVA